VSTPAQRQKSRRQARWRQRQKAGEAVYELALPENAVALALIETQRLTPAQALDRGAVRDALTEMLTDWAAAWAEHVC
jgi:hypothetical protein